MPDARCPMPNARCPMPNAHSPRSPYLQLDLGEIFISKIAYPKVLFLSDYRMMQRKHIVGLLGERGDTNTRQK